MSNEYIKYASDIIERFFEGSYPEELEARIQHWLIEGDNEEDKDYALEMFWDNLPMLSDKSAKDALSNIKSRAVIGTDENHTKLKTITLRRRIMTVAAVLLPFIIIISTYVLWNYQTNPVSHKQEITEEVIKMMVYEMGAGEEGEIILADGSTVWMAENSRMETPERFFDIEREVFFSGKGKFNIISMIDTPFIVRTEALTVRVAGTEFELDAYNCEKNVSVNLLSGNLAVETAAGEIIELKPGQLLTYNVESDRAVVTSTVRPGVQMSKTEIEIPEPIGEALIFENATLEDIFRTLELRFGIKIETGKEELTDERFSVKFIYGENIDKIMEILEVLAGGFSYTIVNNTVYVKVELASEK